MLLPATRCVTQRLTAQCTSLRHSSFKVFPIEAKLELAENKQN